MEANLPQKNTGLPENNQIGSIKNQLQYPFDYETQRALDEYLGRNQAYPVGSAFISFVATNPATLLGYGTWVAAAEGYALVGFKSGDSDFGAAGIVAAGEKQHALIANENAAHTHDVPLYVNSGGVATVILASNLTTGFGAQTTSSSGLGTPHNNIQPSYVVYVWQRTA